MICRRICPVKPLQGGVPQLAVGIPLRAGRKFGVLMSGECEAGSRQEQCVADGASAGQFVQFLAGDKPTWKERDGLGLRFVGMHQ